MSFSPIKTLFFLHPPGSGMLVVTVISRSKDWGALKREEKTDTSLCPKTGQLIRFVRMFLLNKHYSTYFSTIK